MSPTIVTMKQRDKALRIYAAALPLIAEAVGVDPKAAHNLVLRKVLFDDLQMLIPKPAAPSPPLQAAEIDVSSHVDQPSPVESSQAGEGTLSQDELPPWKRGPQPTIAEPEQETTPVMQMKPASQAMWDEKTSSGLVTLRDKNTGSYLNMDGSGVTINRSHAYRGSITQAKAMRKQKAAAAGMSISHFIQK